MKRLIFIVSVILLMGIYPVQAQENTYDIYTYTVSDGKATIIDVDENAVGEIVIPSMLDGYPVTEIGYMSFQSCGGITAVTIPDGVNRINAYAFNCCITLSEVKIPDSVTEIGSWAFASTAIESITLPDRVSIIESSLFRGSKLKEVEFKGEIVRIWDSAFYGCENLKEFTIPKTVTDIQDDVFGNCFALENIFVEEGNPNYSSIDGHLFDKEQTTLIRYVLGKNEESYSVPDSVVHIGERAFVNAQLKDIIMGNNVKTIGKEAFVGCTFTSFIIPDGIVEIGEDAFKWCMKLTDITIPTSVTTVKAHAFYDCKAIENVYISDLATWCGISFEEYDSNPLCFAKNLYVNGTPVESLIIPTGVTYIGAHTFPDISLEKIVIPGTVKVIDSSAFSGCEAEEIVLGYGIEKIGKNAFSYNMTLTELTIPGSVKIIEDSAFSSCRYLENAVLCDGVVYINKNAFRDCCSMKTITIPDSVKEIKESAFDYCSELETVYFNGTKTAWDKIKIGEKNTYLTEANIIYGKTEDPQPDESRSFDIEVNGSNIIIKSQNCEDIDSGTVILALYGEGGRLIRSYTADFSEEVTFKDVELGGTTRVMLWSSIGEMMPMVIN